ncbi:hypothetical protein BJX66DRAFT_115548 [Aspergillus keveii]|uniref:Uncharacterized protein n=1 Tax=Aspergillus keveii TaxID=714993 RepID=A0ABR4FKF9_9EURO
MSHTTYANITTHLCLPTYLLTNIPLYLFNHFLSVHRTNEKIERNMEHAIMQAK